MGNRMLSPISSFYPLPIYPLPEGALKGPFPILQMLVQQFPRPEDVRFDGA